MRDVPRSMSDAFSPFWLVDLDQPSYTYPYPLFFFNHVTGMERKPRKWSNTSFGEGVRLCIPIWYLFGRRKQGLTAFLTRPVQWGHLPYGRAPSTGWIWCLHSQWIGKPRVANAGHVIFKRAQAMQKHWIPICGPADIQNDRESRVCFQSTHLHIRSGGQISFSKLYQGSH